MAGPLIDLIARPPEYVSTLLPEPSYAKSGKEVSLVTFVGLSK